MVFRYLSDTRQCTCLSSEVGIVGLCDHHPDFVVPRNHARTKTSRKRRAACSLSLRENHVSLHRTLSRAYSRHEKAQGQDCEDFSGHHILLLVAHSNLLCRRGLQPFRERALARSGPERVSADRIHEKKRRIEKSVPEVSIHPPLFARHSNLSYLGFQQLQAVSASECGSPSTSAVG